jgi:hypothetical protein
MREIVSGYAGIGNQLIGLGTMLCVLNNTTFKIISKPIGFSTEHQLDPPYRYMTDRVGPRFHHEI